MNKIILKLGKAIVKLLFPEDKKMEFRECRIYKFLMLYLPIILLSLLVTLLIIYNRGLID